MHRVLAGRYFGDALWSIIPTLQSLQTQSDIVRREPGPIYSYKRVSLGDVGYIRQGRFHLLFSAGIPLGPRERGKDVPSTFEQLEVGPIIKGENIPSEKIVAKAVRKIGVDVGVSAAVAGCVRAYFCLTGYHRLIEYSSPGLGPGAKMKFALTQGQGATLLTKHDIHREDIERVDRFKTYIKKYYDSWLGFARENEHGDVRPILVTGVHLTRDFAMIAYSDSETHMECEFSVEVPAVVSGHASLWGSWSTPELVHKTCGPDPLRIQGNSSSDQSPTPDSTIPAENNQCVFIRYYTIRRKLFIPMVIKAGAGPHQLPKGNPGNDDASEGISLDLSEDDSTEVDYPETGSPADTSDEVIHNVPLVGPEHCPHLPLLINLTKDDRDYFDIVADFIFQVSFFPGRFVRSNTFQQRSDAKSVLLHHYEIQDFLHVRFCI